MLVREAKEPLNNPDAECGERDADRALLRFGNPGRASYADQAVRALANTRVRLTDVQRDNETLRFQNEQLLRKLVAVSRRAVVATHLAHHDTLTGLPNHLLLIKRLQQAIADASRHQLMLALLFVDLDGFKVVNDRLGHKAGDRLLAVVGARIAACVRSDDIASRYGGDEFVVLLRNLDDPAVVGGIGNKIRASIGRHYRIEDEAVALTASIGIAMYPADGATYADLLSCADAAMYRSKEARRTLCSLPGQPSTGCPTPHGR